MTKQELRERIAATKTGKERTRYASALMRATVEHARPRVAAGESLSIVADELGCTGSRSPRGSVPRSFRGFDRDARRPGAISGAVLTA
jgi:hypothetical protein